MPSQDFHDIPNSPSDVSPDVPSGTPRIHDDELRALTLIHDGDPNGNSTRSLDDSESQPRSFIDSREEQEASREAQPLSSNVDNPTEVSLGGTGRSECPSAVPLLRRLQSSTATKPPKPTVFDRLKEFMGQVCCSSLKSNSDSHTDQQSGVEEGGSYTERMQGTSLE
ncbi:hypothetical protein M231_01358 [Tremella mesenterica]|uniref:Uncharacterized protein n=1 Tax=Tremella mesenterica TaxID=5217 RepID=A0A4Q1BU12_TREME|nr:uncharacterized protein TREMEDRAFT_62850 [Tremella mesenterica DSM 1558]EIW69124.1 hypothetical protein TREMEDRAFT_62850 [Tremella mesenterica DSM 1558]RXK41452.1 hypothetical protein M231_01358 [Tremella mesenterica]